MRFRFSEFSRTDFKHEQIHLNKAIDFMRSSSCYVKYLKTSKRSLEIVILIQKVDDTNNDMHTVS